MKTSDLFPDSPVPGSFAALAERWSMRARRLPSWPTEAALIRKHLLPELGADPLAAITDERVELFRADLEVELKPGSVNRVLTTLRAILRYGVRPLRWIPSAPVVQLAWTPKRPKYRYLKTDDEVRRFLRAAKAYRKIRGQVDGFVYALFACAAYTGMRLGELCALKKSSIDFERQIITVEASHDDTTKSGESRTVPILDALLPVLEAHVLRTAGELLFPNARGKQHTRFSRIFDEVLRDVLKASMLPDRYITFHGLRHTFASHWVMKGGDLFKLQEILGHSSIEMTRRYAHLAPHAFDVDRARFNSLLPERSGELVQLPLVRSA